MSRPYYTPVQLLSIFIMAGFDTIQVDYEQLEEIAKRFSMEGERVNDLIRVILIPYQQLQDGGWEGKAATAFFQEMEGEILPILYRLLDAFESGETLVEQIAQRFQTAEEEAAAQIDFDVSGIGVGGGPGNSSFSGSWTAQIPGRWAANGVRSIGFTPDEIGGDGRLQGSIELPSGQKIPAKLSVTEMKPLFEKR